MIAELPAQLGSKRAPDHDSNAKISTAAVGINPEQLGRRPHMRMTRWCQRVLVVLCFALVAGFAARSHAKPRVGLGGGLGDPLGPSLKVFFHPQHALQVDFGWAPMHHGNGILHANYLFHFRPFVSNKVMDFGLYLGGGLGMAFWSGRYYYYDHPYYGDRNCRPRPGPDDCYYGHGGAGMIVRAPVGLFFHWMKVPIDTVVEGGWSPYVVPWDPFHGDFSVKIRYYF